MPISLVLAGIRAKKPKSPTQTPTPIKTYVLQMAERPYTLSWCYTFDAPSDDIACTLAKGWLATDPTARAAPGIGLFSQGKRLMEFGPEMAEPSHNAHDAHEF